MASEHETAEDFAKAVKCKVFALCTRSATTTIQHPVLGQVPACTKCADWYERMGKGRQ